MSVIYRGQVIRADIGLNEPKLFVVVSNNIRNARLPTVLAAQLTTTAKRPMRSIVPLDGEFVGVVQCDDIIDISVEHEVLKAMGALATADMMRVDEGLRAALAL